MYSFITNPVTNQSYDLFSNKGLLTLQNYLVGGATDPRLKLLQKRRNLPRESHGHQVARTDSEERQLLKEALKKSAPNRQSLVERMVEMGFNPEASAAALEKMNDDITAAIVYEQKRISDELERQRQQEIQVETERQRAAEALAAEAAVAAVESEPVLESLYNIPEELKAVAAENNMSVKEFLRSQLRGELAAALWKRRVREHKARAAGGEWDGEKIEKARNKLYKAYKATIDKKFGKIIFSREKIYKLLRERNEKAKSDMDLAKAEEKALSDRLLNIPTGNARREEKEKLKIEYQKAKDLYQTKFDEWMAADLFGLYSEDFHKFNAHQSYMSWSLQRNQNWLRFLEGEITLEELQAELKRIAAYLSTDEAEYTTIPSWSLHAIKAKRAARQ